MYLLIARKSIYGIELQKLYRLPLTLKQLHSILFRFLSSPMKRVEAFFFEDKTTAIKVYLNRLAEKLDYRSTHFGFSAYSDKYFTLNIASTNREYELNKMYIVPASSLEISLDIATHQKKWSSLMLTKTGAYFDSRSQNFCSVMVFLEDLEKYSFSSFNELVDVVNSCFDYFNKGCLDKEFPGIREVDVDFTNLYEFYEIARRTNAAEQYCNCSRFREIVVCSCRERQLDLPKTEVVGNKVRFVSGCFEKVVHIAIRYALGRNIDIYATDEIAFCVCEFYDLDLVEVAEVEILKKIDFNLLLQYIKQKNESVNLFELLK